MKIAYAGFDLMAPALEALTKNNELLRLFTCRVDGVYETNTQVIAIAERLHVPHTCERITRRDIDELLEEDCDLLISAGYYHLIPVDSRLKMVNIHPALLPCGRGAWPMPLAILDGLKESGVTVHKTEKDFDSGDILLQERFAIDNDETLTSFMEKVNRLLPSMMDRLTSELDALWSSARAQGYGEYQPQPDPEYYVLTAKDTVEYADRVLRAFFGFPCYYNDGENVHELVSYRAFQGTGDDNTLPLADGYIRQVFAI